MKHKWAHQVGEQISWETTDRETGREVTLSGVIWRRDVAEWLAEPVAFYDTVSPGQSRLQGHRVWLVDTPQGARNIRPLDEVAAARRAGLAFLPMTLF